jgi:hypothetical protein
MVVQWMKRSYISTKPEVLKTKAYIHMKVINSSWRATWGEQGYIRITHNKNNQYGIASMASFPTV